MNNPNTKYGILLSKEQLDVLSRPGVYNRMNVYRAICEKTTIQPYEIVKRGIHLTINRGECLYPNTQIEKDLDINRKTVQEIIHELNMVGAIKSTSGNRGTVHINQALAFWFVDGKDEAIKNPFYSRNPSCQATKGIKPKMLKAVDSKKEGSEGISVDSVEVTNATKSKENIEVNVVDSSASTAENESSSPFIHSPTPPVPASDKVPSLGIDKTKSAAQHRNSSKFAKVHNLHQKHYDDKHKR